MSSRSDIRLRREEHELPKSVESILALMRDILSSGNVYKFVLESGNPVLVYRQSDESGLAETELTLDDALQRAEIFEYENPEASPFEVMFDITHVVTSYGGYPVCWATGMNQTDLLDRWVKAEERGLPGTVDTIFTFPVFRMKMLPEDTLILCAAKRQDGEIDDVSLAVKTAIELRGPYADEGSVADHPVGDDPKGGARAAGGVEAPPEGGSRGGWIPKSVVGGRLG